MKNVLRIGIMILITVVLCLCFEGIAFAEGTVTVSGICGENGDNLTWTLYDTGELVIDGTGAMANYSGGTAPWYKNRVSITSVTIQDGVTSVGDNAFYYCIKLTDVSIPAGVASIGERAFDNCIKLYDLVIPEGVAGIYNYVFNGCRSLTSVTIPESVRSIGSSAFSGCSSLTSVTIPEGVTSIGGAAFYGCSSLTSVTIPDGVTSIEYDAFRSCSSLTSVTIPEGVTSIGSCVFQGCSGLTSITIPESMTSIGNWAFSDCSSLTSVTIPEGVTSIFNAFYGCSSLTSIIVDDANQVYCDLKGVLFNKSKTEINCYPAGRVGEYAIPKGVTSIEYNAFYGCSGLTSVTIPESVTRIGDRAFSGCSSLADVYYGGSLLEWAAITNNIENNSPLLSATLHCSPVTVTWGDLSWTLDDEGTLTVSGSGEMNNYVDDSYEPVPWLQYLDSIKKVVIESGVTSICNDAFYSCSSLTSVTIPSSVTSIGWNAFGYCSSLTSVTIPSSVTSIGGGAFSGCTSLTNITVDQANTAYCDVDGVLFNKTKTEILCCPARRQGTYAIPSSVTRIGVVAFRDCSSLTSVTIPSSVTTIYNGAFGGCSSLTSVTIGTGVTIIDSFVFFGCSSLTSVTIPESVTRIGWCAFGSCSRLTNVTIPEGVTSIGDSAFRSCSSLTSVTIPESMTSIGDSAFSECGSISTVIYGGTAAQWEQIAIGEGNEALTKATIHYGLIPQVYTITYDANGGTDAPGTQTKTQNIALTLSDVRPTRGNTSPSSYSVRLNPNDGSQSVSILRAARTESYTFRTWNTAADGSGTDYAPGANYTTDADLTLYAQWDSTTATAAVTLPELARGGALFLGWAPSRDAESGVTGKYTPSGNVTLYALWAQADLVLPASLTAIEAEAFTGGAFTYVLVPEGVEAIGSGAFAGCPNLRYVEICGTKTEIDPAAFDGVTGLTIIAPSGSKAETWAAEHSVNFQPAA